MIYRIKTFEKSRYTPSTWSPFSIELISLSIKKVSAGCVEWFLRKPNWYSNSILFSFRKSINLLYIIRSNTLESVHSIDTGR